MKRVYCFVVFVLLLCLPTFISAQLPSGVQIPAGKGGVEPILPFVEITDDCHVTYDFKLQVFNLDYLNGVDYSFWSRGEPLPPALDIPEEFGPMYLRCVLNDQVEEVLVESLNIESGANGEHVFVFEHSMTMNIVANCDVENPTEQIYFVRMSLLLGQSPYPNPVEYPGSEIDPILNYLYPVCNLMSTNNLFDCNYLPTTCPISSCEHKDWADWFEYRSYLCYSDCEEGTGSDYNTDYFNGSDSNIDARNNLSTEDAISSNYEIFPNPFTTEIQILWESTSEKSKIRLYNSNGQLVKSWINVKHQIGEITNLSTFELPKGVYFLIVHDEDKSTHQKLIKT